jgi:predicted lipase
MFLSFLALALVIFFSKPAWAVTVNPDVLVSLELYSGYASAAYCLSNYDAKSNAVARFPVNSYSKNGSATVSYQFLRVGEQETTGMVLLDHDEQAVVISFRGTQSQTDWDTNFDFFQDDVDDFCGKGCEVHSGFLSSWRGVSDEVLRQRKELLEQHKGYRTVVTGHSLGGALAHVCTAAILNAEPNAELSLYSYGSPRVGNRVFANFINKGLGLKNFRVTHMNDPVPRVPQPWLGGYVHTSPEYRTPVLDPHQGLANVGC